MVPRPRKDCPKCGDPDAFGYTRLRFVRLTYGAGLMRWECRTCEYILMGKPLDEDVQP
jgi:rubredoxin